MTIQIKPTKVIPKSKIEEVHVGLSTYNDKQLIDVRIFAAWNGDEFRPTQKGVSLPINKIDEVIEGLKMARDDAVTRGWLK